jgi:hypothetical protein
LRTSLQGLGGRRGASWVIKYPFDDQWIETDLASEYCHPIPKISHLENLWYFISNAHVAIDSSGLAILHDSFIHGHNGGQYLNRNREYLWDLGRENWKYFGSFFMDSLLRLPSPVHLSGSVAVLADE